jgi:hypothetical protein
MENNMVASKTTGGKKKEARKKIKIMALVPPLSLTKEQEKALAKALKGAAETCIDSMGVAPISVVADWEEIQQQPKK